MEGKRPRQESPPRAIETLAETSQHVVEKKINVTMNANLLQCYACSGPLMPPLFQCTKGHVSCSECCPDGYLDDDEVECLMCREPETANRCRAVGCVLAGVHVPCPFRQHGCAKMIPYPSLQAHRMSCVHARRHCPMSGCAGYAGGKPLREHVRQDHPGVVRTAILLGCLTPLLMRVHEQARVVTVRGYGGLGDSEFLVVVGQYKELGRALSVVHLVDESMDERDFKHKIEVVGKAGVLSLSGETLRAERLDEPYEASPFLFVPNETREAREDYFRVFIQLK